MASDLNTRPWVEERCSYGLGRGGGGGSEMALCRADDLFKDSAMLHRLCSV